MTEVTCHVFDSDFIQKDDDIIDGLHLWCLDRDSNPVHIMVKNPPIYMYIELPQTPLVNKWDNDAVDMLFENFKRSHGKCAPFMMEFTEREKLYYYKGGEVTPMARIFFRTPREMNICSYRLTKPHEYQDFGNLIFRVYEKDISIRRKIFTIRKTKYCQWFRFIGTEIPITHRDRQATAGTTDRPIREFILNDYSKINPIDNLESKGWVTRPRILSFDIETYTDNHHALPDMHNPKHVVYMVSCLFQVTGDKNSREQYVIVSENCNPIPGVNIIVAEGEEDLLVTFYDLVESLDPDILTGYNIFGYDYPYMDARYTMYRDQYGDASRLQGYIPEMSNSEWASGAYGKTVISYLQMPGRISIDLFPLIKRDYKFDKYSLDFVSNKLLGDQKVQIDHKDIFKAYESKDIEQITHITKYCIQDSALVLDLYEKMNVWVGLVEMANIVGVEIMDLFTRGQQIRCVSQIYDMTARRKIVLNSRDQPEIEYEGGKVQDPLVGINDFTFSIDFNSLYPSIMMAYNICFTTLIPKIYEDDYDDADVNTIEIRPGISFKFVKSHIKRGILPTLVENLVNERKAVRKEIKSLEDYLKNNSDLSEEIIRQTQLTITVLDKRQLALKVSANSMYGFLGVRQGGKLPLIEGAISITARGRQLITEVNEYLVKTHNAIIVYGDTDSSMVRIPTVTTWAECYEVADRLAEEVTALFPPPLKMEVENIMRFLGITKKKYAAFLFNPDGTPKTEPGPISPDGSQSQVEKIYKRGIVLTRRDNFPYLRKIYSEVLRAVLQRRPMEYTFKIILDAVVDVMSGDIPARGNFTIIRGIGKEYASDGYFMKVFSDELAKMGHPAAAGDRLEYVIVEPPLKFDENGNQITIPLGQRMRLIEMYEDSLAYDESVDGPRPPDVYPVEKIDYMYYITNGLQNPIDQLFTAGYHEELSGTSLCDVGYTPQNSTCKPITIKQPIKMIMLLFKDSMKKGDCTMDECISFIKDNLYSWFLEEKKGSVKIDRHLVREVAPDDDGGEADGEADSGEAEELRF